MITTIQQRIGEIMFNKPSREIDRVFLHCSASDHKHHDKVSAIKKMHLDRGWSDIGYHYFITKAGKLQNGRPIEKTPAAQRGHNTGTVAICCHGLREDKFTKEQFDTLKKLCVAINNAYDGRVTFHGHKEVAAKACPVFDYKKVLKLDEFGRLGLSGVTAAKVKNKTGTEPDKLPDLELGDRGKSVAYLQRLLFIKDDGIFGPKTAEAVKDFKEAHDLFRSDKVESHVWKLLLDDKQRDHID
ncbi:MAG: N-acetylmuramoyl-L-alanine amidase [Pseudomonadota bacterium]